MSLSIEMYDIKEIEWPDPLDETRSYFRDKKNLSRVCVCVCVHNYLGLWTVRVMVTQKFKEAQSRLALQQKTPLTMSNTYNTAKIGHSSAQNADRLRENYASVLLRKQTPNTHTRAHTPPVWWHIPWALPPA